MGIAFMHIEKIKNPASLKSIFMHNYRVNNVKNADPALLDQNEELVKMGGRDYYQVFKGRLEMLKELNPDKKILRSNGTPAIEIVTSMPRSDLEHVNLEKWKEDNLMWLKKTFNRCPEKYGDNVISVMYHGDEAGSVHCHAIVLPVDEKGVFNYSAFVNGGQDLKNLQKTYGDLMEKNHHLQRGIEGSRAKHEDIKRLYTQLNQNLRVDDIPKQIEGETRESYLERIEDFFKDVRAGALKKQKDLEGEVHRYKTMCRNKDVQIHQIEREKDEVEYKYKALVQKYADGNEPDFLKILEDQAKLKLCLEMTTDMDDKERISCEIQRAVLWSEKNLNPKLYEADIEPILKEDYREEGNEKDAEQLTIIDERFVF